MTMQIQITECVLNDTVRKKEAILMIYSFTHSNVNFLTILMPKAGPLESFLLTFLYEECFSCL